jgi:hypothetical protein
MIYIGIDNGISGSIGVIDDNGVAYQFATPILRTLNYQKTKVKYISRIDVYAFRSILKNILEQSNSSSPETTIKCLIERPMVNPMRFEATTSALRALEATLIVLEDFNIGFDYIDSKEWQKAILPYISVADKKDFPAKLKMVSKQVGMRKYPNIDWENFKDADGVLIADYCQQKYGEIK